MALHKSVFGHSATVSAPNLATHIAVSFCVSWGRVMGTSRDHRKCAEECVAMAQAANDDNGKVLWLTLALSWVRLAEHVAHGNDHRSDGDRDRGREVAASTE